MLRMILDGPLPGPINMDRDTELLRRWRPGQAPVLRIYRWRPFAVSCGFHQSLADFDRAEVARHRFDLVQRPTGGRAILHAEELTYCIVGPSPSPLFGDSLHACYERINEVLVAFLRGQGYDPEISSGEERGQMRQAVCFRSAGRHEIRIQGRKIIGSAQRRLGGVFLQHGSILTGPRHADLLQLLRPARRGDLSRDRLLAVTTDLGRLRGAPLGEAELAGLAADLAATFAQVLQLEPRRLSWDDLAASWDTSAAG